MAAPKIVGLEAEYGVVRGLRTDERELQRAAASMTRNVGRVASINAAVGDDVRGGTQFALVNGGRAYLDGWEPTTNGWLEIATPECRDALSVLRYQLASDAIAVAAADADALEQTNQGSFDHCIRLYRKAADVYGNTRGLHENYSVPGAGRSNHSDDVAYAFSGPRLLISGAGAPPESGRTAISINARPTAHSMFAVYKGSRLQIASGEHKRCHVSQFLEVGTMQFVLAMYEDGVPLNDLATSDRPWHVYARIGADAALEQRYELDSGMQVYALDLLEEYRDRAVGWAARHGYDAVGGERVGRLVLDWWGKVVDGLRYDRSKLFGVLDWVTKEVLFAQEAERLGVALNSMEIQRFDLLYHDLRPQTSRFERLRRRKLIHELVHPRDIARATTEPPADTRAWTRTAVLTANARDGIVDERLEWSEYTPEPWGGTRAAFEATTRAQADWQWDDPAERLAVLAEARFFEGRPGVNGLRALEDFIWSDDVRSGAVEPARMAPTIASVVRRVTRDAEIEAMDPHVPLAQLCKTLRVLQSLDDWADGAFGRADELSQRIRTAAMRELRHGRARANDISEVLGIALPESDAASLTWLLTAHAAAADGGNPSLVLQTIDAYGRNRFGSFGTQPRSPAAGIDKSRG